MGICSVCKGQMTVYEEGQTRHPTCYEFGTVDVLDGNPFVDPSGNMNGEALAIKQEITDMILWADANSPRSQQVGIGPSEVGAECERFLAYRIAGVSPVNEYDPWPAIVGTSVHTWLTDAVNEYSAFTGSTRYLTETVVHPDPIMIGHSDLYDAKRKMVIDYKTVSTTNMRKFKEEGPSESYITQINLYAKGQIAAGRPVDKVCLVIIGRAGWLSDMYVWVQDYDPDIAQQALDRVYTLGAKLLDLDIVNQSHRFEEIEPTPSRLCGWCPFYRQGVKDGQGANADGCPGR